MITDDHYKELDELLKAAVENEDELSDWENAFVSEWIDKLAVYQTNVRISDKQQAVLDRIEDKLKKKGLL